MEECWSLSYSGTMALQNKKLCRRNLELSLVLALPVVDPNILELAETFLLEIQTGVSQEFQDLRAHSVKAIG